MISSFGPHGWMTFSLGHDLEAQEDVVRCFKGVIV